MTSRIYGTLKLLALDLDTSYTTNGDGCQVDLT